MCAAMHRKRSSSFFEDPSQAEAAAASPPSSKRARFRGDGHGHGGGSPKPPRSCAVDPDLVAVLRARFPSVRLEFIEKALEECENDLDSAIKCLLPLRLEPTELNVDPLYQSPNEMSTEVNQGITECNEVPAPIGTVPGADNLAPGTTQWVEILMNEMASSSNPDDAKARASRVLEAFQKSTVSCIHTEVMQRFQKEISSYKEQFEAVIKDNNILKKAVTIQHERQKEHEQRNQELQQLKQLVVQYREQIRSLEINNYALSMHLRQSQQGSSIPGHFHRDIL